MTTATTQVRVAGPADFAQAFGVSRETAGRLELYADLLRTWQKTINLVAPSTLPDVWQRHFADSAQLVAVANVGPEAKWVDIGSGAGFPGLVVAMLRNEAAGAVPVTLVESDSRKAAFLREVARRTAVAVDIRAKRIESDATRFNLPATEVVSARALAPLARLLDLASPYLAAGGRAVFLKGREWEREIAEASTEWRFDVETRASVTDPEARVLVLGDIARR